jgi:hypothetical protein
MANCGGCGGSTEGATRAQCVSQPAAAARLPSFFPASSPHCFSSCCLPAERSPESQPATEAGRQLFVLHGGKGNERSRAESQPTDRQAAVTEAVCSSLSPVLPSPPPLCGALASPQSFRRCQSELSGRPAC